MDFLVLFLVYLVCVLTSVLLLCIYSKRTHTLAGEILTYGPQVFSRFIPRWLQRATQKAFHHLFHTRNCIFIILHLALEGAVYSEYTWEILYFCQELEFSPYPLLLPYLLLIINLFFFFLSCTTNPGIITKSNEESFLQVYEYDEVIFLKNMKCPTCDLRKPARSKHCSICNRCVHRFDHHCIWVNNCIGALNARYFLIYLLTLTAMAASIAIITTAFLIHLALVSGMTLGTYLDDHGQKQPVDIAFLVQYLFLTFPRIVFMLGFVIVLCLLLGGYLCFALYLSVTNQTANEWYKSSRAKCHRCHNSDPVQEKNSAYKNIYAKDAWTNLKEIFKPITDCEKKK